MSVFWWCAGIGGARVSRRGWRAVPRSAVPRARGGLLPAWRSWSWEGLAVAGREYDDLGFPGDGRLGGGGVRKFRAGFLRAPGVPLPSGEVECVQGGVGGGVRRGGDGLQ